MKFEEILPLMREGKKAFLSSEKETGVYWICGRQQILDYADTSVPVIIKMEKDGTFLADKYSWGIPRWAIMREDWEIIE